MAVTTSTYNHTAQRFASGANLASKTYKLMLCTAATFDATDATLAEITATEVANGNGYTTGGASVPGVTISAINTRDAKFTATTVTWSATGGQLSASYAILYCATDTGSPPLLFIDFGGVETAADGTDFRVVWNTDGIFKFEVV